MMNTKIQSKSQRQAAVVAGIAIIIMTIAATIANDFTIGSLVEENNAPETLKNIMASKITFNVGVFSWLIILMSDVFAAWGLYIFFKSVNKNLSLMAAWFRLIYAAMLAATIFNLVYVSLIIHQVGIGYEGSSQLSEQVMFYLNAFNKMFSVSLIVFSIHILLLGYLSLKSEYIPRIFGILLWIAFAGYVYTNTVKFLFPEFDDITRIVEMIFLLPMLSEVALGIWLLIIGLRKEVNNE